MIHSYLDLWPKYKLQAERQCQSWLKNALDLDTTKALRGYMSAIDKKTVEHIAKLARLKLSDAEALEYSEQLKKVLNYFEQISKINTEGVEPLVTPVEIKARWREDIARSNFTAEEMTSNSPERTGNLFTVPPVV